MPTPDASQFTQLKKYSAAIASRNETQPQKRTITRTMQPLPSVLHPLKFLPSFTNKYTTATNFVPINRVTGIQAKTKVPGGHVFGDSDEMPDSFDFNGSFAYWGPDQSAMAKPCNFRFAPGATSYTINNNTGLTQSLWNGIEFKVEVSIPSGSSYRVNILSPQMYGSFGRECPLPDGGGGGTEPTYDETNVTNASFTNDGVTISESITANSPFTYDLYGGTNRYGHYFNLNSLSSDYTYTFETIGANFGIKDNDTVIALFNTQNKARINDNENGILNSWDDDGGKEPLSKLTDISISGNWCLVVAPYDEVRTGTFTLKITRTTITAP